MNLKISQVNTNTSTPKSVTNKQSNTGTSNAQSNTPKNNTQTVVPSIKDPFGGKTLSAVSTQAINILLALIVIAAVIVIIISGFRMITNGDNPLQLSAAKRAIAWAIIGLLVAFMSFGIVQIVQNLLQK